MMVQFAAEKTEAGTLAFEPRDHFVFGKLPAPFLVGMFPAVNGYFLIPNYGTIIAAINFDRSGTTRIGASISEARRRNWSLSTRTSRRGNLPISSGYEPISLPRLAARVLLKSLFDFGKTMKS